MSGYGGNQYTQQQYDAVPQGDMYAELLGPFWEQQTQEVSQVGKDAAEFKNHQLPLARIKKVSALVRSRTVVCCPGTWHRSWTCRCCVLCGLQYGRLQPAEHDASSCSARTGLSHHAASVVHGVRV
eukprot:GHRQ01021188.1.p3 GENE.GHRQ01021188.1~~GHRQ01021188.1.p3  ORF type:complete len:126 (+),score=22.35 GHRQ01021188.1:495-872(+)